MRELTFEKQGRVNTELLHQELNTWNDVVYVSVSTNPREIIVRVEDATTTQQETEVQAVVENHDATEKSAEQRKLDATKGAMAAMKQAAANFDPAQAALRLAELNQELGGIVNGDAAENVNATQVVQNFHQVVKRIERLEMLMLYVLSEVWQDNG